MPAMRIGVAWRGGWDPAITEATVPDNMTGKTGRIQAGVTSGSRSQYRFFGIEEELQDKVDQYDSFRKNG